MSTLRERLIMERSEYGPVRVTGEFLTVYGFNYQLIIRKAATTYMPLNDFKKMVRVIKGVLDPDEYYEYLSTIEQITADRRFTIHAECERDERPLRKDERILLDRLAKMDKFLDKQIRDLPEWAYGE